MVRTPVLAIFGFVALAAASSKLPLKHLAGPPSEFATHRVPSTNDARIGENSCLVDVPLDALVKDTTQVVEVDLVADSETQFVFSLLTPSLSALALALKDPNGNAVSLAGRTLPSVFPTSISSTFSEKINVTVYSFFDDDIVQGVYKLAITVAPGAQVVSPAMRVLVFNEAAIGGVSRLASYKAQVGDDVAFQAWLGQGSAPSARSGVKGRQPLAHDTTWAPTVSTVPTSQAKMVKAEVTITLPGGASRTVVMRDDGLLGDAVAGDSVFTGGIKAVQAGLYTSVVQLEGRDSAGRLLRRTVQQMMPVVADEVAVTKSIVVRHSSVDAVTWTPTAAAVASGAAALHLDALHSELLIEAADVLEVLIGVSDASSGKYRVYTELWGKSGTEPVAWFGGMAIPVDVTTSTGAAGSAVPVQMDGAWLASATGPFVLKHTTVYDVASGAVLSNVEDAIALPDTFAKAAFHAAGAASRSIQVAYSAAGMTRSLLHKGDAQNLAIPASTVTTTPLNSVQARFGIPPVALFEGEFAARATANVTTQTVAPSLDLVKGYLMDRPRTIAAIGDAMLRRDSRVSGARHGTALLHGYCADANVFLSTADVWTYNPIYFEDLMASRTTDDFASRVHAFAESKGLDSYAAVAHSQGGAVSTQLANFYWSGLDRATYRALAAASPRAVSAFPAGHVNGPAASTLGAATVTPRSVQSIGTPYHGNTMAGTLAGMGQVFGVGCGTNFDMSLDGAKLWTAGISDATRASIYFATTTYQLNSLFGDYCNIAVNSVLQWPNDGTSEIVYTVLEGANDLGNTEKQCHTADMRYAAQWSDRNRNIQFNEHAL